VVRHPPLRLGAGGPWVVAAACAALAGTVGAAASRWPAVVDTLASAPVNVATTFGWCVLAALTIGTGLSWREQPTWRVGLGLSLIATAHLHQLFSGLGPGTPDLLFTALHLIGLLGVLSGSVIRFHDEMTLLLSEREQQRVELTEAARHARRAADLAAERDHELANGLAGLSGIAFLLGQPAAGAERPHLRSAVLSELSRLHALLACSPDSAAVGSYDVGRVVTELAALRRATGMDIAVTVEDRLEVTGDRNAFAQVIMNLLANCERHAPGSAVEIRAWRCQDRVAVEVRDDGPGVPQGTEEQVVRPGVTLGPRGGTGLGLGVSARLVAGQGGELRVVPRKPGQRGFTVRLELPLTQRRRSTVPGRI
jgi:two-component system OmpR family sensor kinase